MCRNATGRTAATVILALGASLCSAARARAAGPDLRGRWAGWSCFEPDHSTSLEVVAQHNRHLMVRTGDLVEVESEITAIATIGANGTIHGSGRIDESNRLFFRGKLGNFAKGSAQFLALQLRVVMDEQVVGEGFAILLHMFGGAMWAETPGADVTGMWRGAWESQFQAGCAGGPGGCDLTNETGTQISGTCFFDDVCRPDGLRFDVATPNIGCADLLRPDGSAEIAMIGVDPTQGIIAILIGVVQPATPEAPAMITGEFHLFGSCSDVFAELALGQQVTKVGVVLSTRILSFEGPNATAQRRRYCTASNLQPRPYRTCAGQEPGDRHGTRAAESCASHPGAFSCHVGLGPLIRLSPSCPPAVVGSPSTPRDGRLFFCVRRWSPDCLPRAASKPPRADAVGRRIRLRRAAR